jgi:hypothetical protein
MDEEIKEIQVDEPIAQAQPQSKTKEAITPRKKNSFIKALLIGIIIWCLMAASAAGAYFWRDNIANDFEKQQAASIENYKASIITLSAKLNDLGFTVVEEEEAVACSEVAPTAIVAENIKASITSGNTAALEGYMAASVNVILAASEAYGPQSPIDAVGSVTSFIDQDITAWDYDFDLSAATLTNYKDGDYSQYFPDFALVGKATNNKVISFSFDCNGKIDTVFLSASDSIL